MILKSNSYGAEKCCNYIVGVVTVPDLLYRGSSLAALLWWLSSNTVNKWWRLVRDIESGKGFCFVLASISFTLFIQSWFGEKKWD